MFLDSMTSSPFGGYNGGVGFNQEGNPWFNIANQFTPRNLYDIIRWARYITIQSPTTTEVIRKLATYPITSFNVDTKDDALRKRYADIFKSLKLKEALQNCGFEFFSLGNVFVSVYLPILRTLKCPHCGTAFNAKNAPFLKFRKYNYEGTCPQCGGQGIFHRTDTKSMDPKAINIVKWTPEHIVVDHNPITGEREYYFRIPNALKQKIQKGDRISVDSTPWEFIDAVRTNQDFKFDKESLFHLENISTTGSVNGVAVPPMLSLFTLVFYQATLRKANEAIATEYLTPLRVVFPQAQTANSDPVMAMSLRNFKGNMESAIRIHKRDKNYFLVAPVPVGYSTMAGEGKSLLVSQEIAQAEQQILLSLGVSQELLSGTTNWTSSSVGLRMMENTLLSYTSRIEGLMEWITARITAYLGMEQVPVTMEPFKLLDDSVYQGMLGELAQAGKASYTTLFKEIGLDINEEMENMVKEAANTAAAQVETQYSSEQSQFLAARKGTDTIQKDDSFVLATKKAQATLQELSMAPPDQQAAFMAQLKVMDFSQWWMINQLIASQNGQQQDPDEGQDDQQDDQQAGDADQQDDQSQDQSQTSSSNSTQPKAPGQPRSNKAPKRK